MRKIIKRKIHISTHKRDLIDFINDEFYSHDKHNAFLEFTMKSLPTDNIIVLFYFQKTKRYVETKAFVDGDKFTIEFDTSLINTDETVLGFIYFEKVAQSADVHRFSFGVKVSEIDKLHDIPIEEAKTKRVVAVEDIVTKAELDELFKRIEQNGGTYNDAEIRNSISSIETRVQTLEAKPDKDTVYDDSDVKNRLSTLETNASRYLTEHQSLSDYALKSELYNDSALSERVTRLEQKPAVDTSGLATKEELQEVRNAQPQIDKTDLVTKEELEAKGYLTVHQNLEEYAKKSEIPERYNDASLVERVTSLESKAIANGSYNDKPLLDKINAIEEQFRNASNLYLTSHQSLEHLVTKQELDGKGYITQHQDISGLVTRDELNQKGYLTNHQDLSEYAKKTELYNDTVLKERVVALENKAPVDLSHLVTRDELDGKHYLTEHQPLTDYALKSEIPQSYNDSELKSRLTALEAKEDKDTVYNDTEIKSRLAAIESKNYLTEHQSLANYALKSEVPQAYNDTDLKERVTSLEAKALANGAYDDSNLRTRIHALETKEDKDTVYDDAEVQRRLSVLEAKPDVQVDTLVTKQELEAKGYLTNHQDVSGLATNSKVEAVEQRVQVLENKPDVDLSHVVTKDELASKNYLTTHQDISGLVTKQELEDKHYIQDVSNLATTEKVTAVENRVQALENKSGVTHEELENKHYLVEHQSLDGLVTKEELASKNYLTNHQSLDGYVTKSELEQAGYIKEHQSLTDYAKKSEMAELVTKEELESKGYIQDISGLATKQELEAAKASIPQPYNDTEIREELARKVNTDTLATLATKQELQTNDEEVKRRLTTLEGKTDNFITGVSVNKEGSNVTLTYNYVDGQSKNVSFTDSDTVNVAYDDSGLKTRLTNLENRPQIDVTTLVSKAELPNLIQHQSLEEYAKKSELPAPYNDSALVSRINALEVKTDNDTVYNDTEVKQRLTALESRPTGQSEMRGTGMPNGVVEAPIGATYIDTAKTNGALKWIKTTDGGNQGWKVAEGDTGWVLGWQEDKGNNKNRMYFRRINDVVHVKFDPKISDNVNAHEHNLILDVGGSDISGKLSIQGFQSVDNIVQTIFKRTMDIPEETYSAENSEASQGCGAVCLHYVYNNDSKRELELHIATSQLSTDENHVNPFSYLTEDEWPTEFPTL